jgi:hypothetical protein
LSAFVSSSQENHQSFSSSHEVHPVTGTEVDPQLRNALSDRRNVARVSRRESLDSCLHARPTSHVAQGIEPTGEDVRLTELNHAIL